MNDVDDIIDSMGLSLSTSQEAHPQEQAEPSSIGPFTNEDIADIMESNGIPEEVFHGEGYEEEAENSTYEENQNEEEDSSYQEALANVDPDVNSTSGEDEQRLEESRESFQEALDEEVPTLPQEERGNEEVSTNEALLPLNSPTLLINDSTTRFSGAEWFNEVQKQKIIVAGIGGIGSNALFQLARMRPSSITIYDDDTVEMVNMAGQLYSYDDIGKAKVNAMANMIFKYSAMTHINAIQSKFTSDTEASDIMMCGFDNMKARKMFFESWYDHIKDKSDEEKAKCLLLDGRLSMDTLQILCIRGDDKYNINRYQCEFLFSDYEADATVCSMKQTTYLACMIGSLMVNLFTNFVAGQLNPIIPYDLPFFTEYDAQNMIFKTEN